MINECTSCEYSELSIDDRWPSGQAWLWPCKFYRFNAALASAILAPHDCVAISSPECTNCEYSEPYINDRLELVLYEKENTPKSTCKWLESLEHETHEKCPHCFSAMMQPISFKSAPSVLVFEINSRNIKVSKTLKFEQEGETVVLDVKGLIYHGDFHFTSHIIGTDGMVS